MPEFSRDLLTPPTESITIREVLGVVENHKWLIAAVVSVFLSAVAVLIYLEPRVYRAEAVIRLKEVTPILVGDREVPELALSRATDPLLSRLEVLRSRTLIGSIVDSLGLRLIAVGGDPLTAEVSGMKVSADAAQDTLTVVFDPGGIVVSGATGTTRAAYGDTIRHEGIEFSLAERPEITELIVAVLPRELAIDRVLANLQVVRREGTDVVDVSYQSPNPYIAQSLANAVVVMFQAQGVEAAVILDGRLPHTMLLEIFTPAGVGTVVVVGGVVVVGAAIGSNPLFCLAQL